MAIASISIPLPGNDGCAAANLEAPPISIPAGPLRTSLDILAQLTGASVGASGALPSIRTRQVTAARSTEQALNIMLRGSGYRAVAINPQAFRIEKVPPRRQTDFASRAQAAADQAPRDETAPERSTIVVTGQKRLQQINTLPVSVAVLSLDPDKDPRRILDSRDVALAIEGLALTNLGPGRNRQFIRGVADSPFNGPSQSTVAIVLDGARISFDSPDPNLRPIDLQRIEVLKGPQGPLYGSGALGGIYHLVTRKPDLSRATADLRTTAQIARGSPGAGIEAVANLPVVEDQFAVRAVAYAQSEPGWIDIIDGRRNANRTWTRGGRLAGRWQVVSDWTVDLTGVGQSIRVSDAQYVTLADTADDDDVDLERPLKEPSHSRFLSAAMRVEGTLGRFRIVSSTSWADQHLGARLDATSAADQFGLTGRATFDTTSKYSVFNQEVRITPGDNGRWIAGISYLSAQSHAIGTIMASGNAPQLVDRADRNVNELAAFAEATVSVASRLDLTLGGRIFRTKGHDELLEKDDARSEPIAEVAISPSLALAWLPNDHSVIFARFAQSLRPGGLTSLSQSNNGRFKADELTTFELGSRWHPSNRKSLSASIFLTEWHDIQSDYLLRNGIVSTRNAGDGRIIGAELSGEWPLSRRVSISSGASMLDAELVRSALGPLARDRRLPVTPWLTARTGVRVDLPIGHWLGNLAAQANYTGRSRLSFDEELDRRMGGYFQMALAAGLRRGCLNISARIDNLFDSEADTFAFGNPFAIRETRQYTPLRPRTFSLSLAREW
ncbi:TonB-dependent receptor [Sphingomonas crocodyli]|nr:TonB-dependent receptor [Sphingomonas crocodyli]